MCVNVSPAACFLLLQEFALFDSSIFTLGIHHLHQEGMFHSCLLVGLIVSRNTHKLLLIWIREELMIYYILGQIQELHFHFFKHVWIKYISLISKIIHGSDDFMGLIFLSVWNVVRLDWWKGTVGPWRSSSCLLSQQMRQFFFLSSFSRCGWIFSLHATSTWRQRKQVTEGKWSTGS